ncbi:hypothetical protein JNJ66_03485 [Candidatus Saccharibacteria bacterium]|nr:hypothetical protein [Candidatus Saccharibacteria bacterium]
MNITDMVTRGMLSQTAENKIEFLRSLLGINSSILIAVVGLVFILYQIDRYNKFKKINYWYLVTYVLAGTTIGLVIPTVFLHSADPHNKNPLYIVAGLSVYILILLSTTYMVLALQSMSTTRIIKRFRYRTALSIKLERFYAKTYNIVSRFFFKVTKTEMKFKGKYKELWRIGTGRNLHPLAKMNKETCLQHGVVGQEYDVAELSPLSVRMDLLVRMAATAADTNDIKVFRQIIERYVNLIKKSDDHQEEYSNDLQSIAGILIRNNRYELYDLLIEDIGTLLLKDKKALKQLDDNNGYLYATLLYQYVGKANDAESAQRGATRLMNLHFAILNANDDDQASNWLTTGDACKQYEIKSASKIAEKEQPYSLWLMYEKANYFTHHGAEVKDVRISIAYLRLISNIGIIGRVYRYHCGATDCSKSIYQHAFETFETLGEYYIDQFDEKDTERYLYAYTDAFEKLTGYEIKFDFRQGKRIINRNKPKMMHTFKIGPTHETSDMESIDYSKLNKKTLHRLMVSRKATW